MCVWVAISYVRAKETMKTKTCLIPRVVQVPTGVWQVALQNSIALHKTLDFSFLAASFFFPLFRGLLMNPFLDGWSAVIKNLELHSALLVFLGPFSLEVAGPDVCWRCWCCSACWRCIFWSFSFLDEREQLCLQSCSFWVSCGWSTAVFFWEASSLLTLVALLRVLVQFLLVLSTLPEREHFAGCAGRHGEEQRAPGGWRALRPLPGGA